MTLKNEYDKDNIFRDKGIDEKRLIEILDSLLSIKDMTYSDFNTVIPFGEDVSELRELEKKFPELGIARYDTKNEGISTLSLLATVTEVLCGKRLGAILQNSEGEADPDDLIIGFTLLDRDVSKEPDDVA